MALWYKDRGPWWDQTNLKDNDGISLVEQRSDSSSLWHFYKKLAHLRHENPALAHGSFKFIEHKNQQVLSFLRRYKGQNIVVTINLTEHPQAISWDSDIWHNSHTYDLLQQKPVSLDKEARLQLAPWHVRVLEME